MDGKINKEN